MVVPSRLYTVMAMSHFTEVGDGKDVGNIIGIEPNHSHFTDVGEGKDAGNRTGIEQNHSQTLEIAIIGHCADSLGTDENIRSHL
jgi:hypothetical protein